MNNLAMLIGRIFSLGVTMFFGLYPISGTFTFDRPLDFRQIQF